MTDDLNPSEPTTASAAPGERRRLPRWLYPLLGIALGLAIGLFYTWVVNPVQFYNTDPVDLRPMHKETWIQLVAAAYRQDGNLDRALSRLAGLKDPLIGQTVADITERAIQSGKPAPRIRALAALADALGARTDPMMIYLATPEATLFYTATPLPPTPTFAPTSTPTGTPTPTATPTRMPTTAPTASASPTTRPTRTLQPTATQIPPYYVEVRRRICTDEREVPRIEVIVQTKDSAGIPGVEIWVTWAGGVDRFFTGLKPDLGLGYADFDMTPGSEYALSVGDPNLQILSGLRVETCLPGEGDADYASWQIVIVATEDTFTPTPTPLASPAATITRTARPAVTTTTTPSRTPQPTRTRADIP
jgi:hypothetical protein